MKGIIDVRDWQVTIDFKTGKTCELNPSIAPDLSRLAARLPYPGDQKDIGVDWVFNAANETIIRYDPNFLYLNFTQPLFNGLYRKRDEETRNITIEKILNGCRRIASENNYSLILVGMGSTVPVRGFISSDKIGGILISSPWSHFMSGILDAQERDLEVLKSLPNVRNVVRKSDILSRHSLSENYINLLPDYILIAEKGYSFKGMFSHNRIMYQTEAFRETLPVYSEIGYPEHIEGVSDKLRTALSNGKKVMLVTIEGIGNEDMTIPYEKMNVLCDEFCYNGYTLVHTLVTGKSIYDCPLPPVHNMTIHKHIPRYYPFSMHDIAHCESSIARDKNIRSAAIGCRSMVTHSIVNADINIECYMRAATNMGVMIGINEDKYKPIV